MTSEWRDKVTWESSAKRRGTVCFEKIDFIHLIILLRVVETSESCLDEIVLSKKKVLYLFAGKQRWGRGMKKWEWNTVRFLFHHKWYQINSILVVPLCSRVVSVLSVLGLEKDNPYSRFENSWETSGDAPLLSFLLPHTCC